MDAASPSPGTKARRRSSMKEGASKPFLPPKETYQHPDPILRRLRLRNKWGETVELRSEFKDAQVVLFLFGQWSSSYRELYDIVDRFAERRPHKCKVIYCSVDSSEDGLRSSLQNRSWLTMEWNDGSNPPELETLASPDPPPLQEPFLLATDKDLESEMHLSDPHGSLYLRPFSRVYLAEKFRVLGVPNLVVYHLGKREVLSQRARIESLRGEKGDEVWSKWERGESVDFSLLDVIGKLKWTIGVAAVAAGYVAAVRLGGVEDVVGKLTEQIGRGMMPGSR